MERAWSNRGPLLILVKHEARVGFVRRGKDIYCFVLVNNHGYIMHASIEGIDFYNIIVKEDCVPNSKFVCLHC